MSSALTTMSFWSQRATTKVDNGGLIASNWMSTTFNDSAWATSATPYVSSGPTSPVEACSFWVHPPLNTSDLYLRSHFTVPGPPWVCCLFWPFLPNSGITTVVYINANNSGVPAYIASPTISNAIAATINALPAGADVLVAMHAPFTSGIWQNPGGGLEAWFGWHVAFLDPTKGGAPYAWGTVTSGANDKGFLGVGDALTHLTPTLVAQTNFPGGPSAPVPNIVKVASNGKTTMMLGADGKLYGCGDNSTGFLGTPDSSVHATPVVINPPTVPFCDISIGTDCAYAVDVSGAVLGWGPNAFGSLGRGNTTPQRTPAILVNQGLSSAYGQVDLIPTNSIACGENFGAILTHQTFGPTQPDFIQLVTAGDNTYGQLAQGTSGGSVLTFANAQNDGSVGSRVPVVLSASHAHLLVGWTNGTTVVIYGAGRAEFGSLGGGPYSAGTGPNHIVNKLTSTSISPLLASFHMTQAGPLAFWVDTDSTLSGVDSHTDLFGDGTGFGGAGDNGWSFTDFAFGHSPSIQVYGTGGPSQGMVGTSSFSASHGLWPIDGLAYASGACQSSEIAGNSAAMFAAFGFHPGWSSSTPTVVPPSDGKLYTWGWGGAGQMGSGADATINIGPISVNGLVRVVGATITIAGMFAICAAAPPPAPPAAYFAQIIG